MFVFVLALVIAALTGWLVETVASGAIDSAVSAFRDLLGGWRPDPWPRGVQEEDRDKPWGTGVVKAVKPLIDAIVDRGLVDTPTSVATGRVSPRTRTR